MLVLLLSLGLSHPPSLLQAGIPVFICTKFTRCERLASSFSQAACRARLEVGYFVVTSCAGCRMLTQVHAARPSLKNHFPQKTFSRL